MKKVAILLCLVATFSFAKKWEYLFYATGLEMKGKKSSIYHVINDGKKVGSSTSKVRGDAATAKANMLRQYIGNYKYKKAYELDILSELGKLGWELISITEEGINKKYYFKR